MQAMTELSVTTSGINARLRVKASHAAVAALFVGLTACGGGGANSQIQDLIPAAAQEAQANPAPGVPVTIPAEITPNSGAVQVADSPVPLVIPGLEENVLGQALVEGAASVSCETDVELFNQTMLAVTNASRLVARACGNVASPAVPTLRWNDRLAQAAVAHARDMTTNNFFDHTGSDGMDVPARAEAAGYLWRAVGENIAGGQLDAAEVQQSWLDSPGHCENVMNSLFTEVGAACLSDPNTDFETYWVVVFGDAQ